MAVSPQVLNDILATALKPIRRWLDDRDVTEIMVNPGGRVFVESRGELHDHGILLEENQIVVALKNVAKQAGRDASSRKASSIVTASVENMRISGALAPVCPDGSFLTIRKHSDKSDRPTLDQLVEDMKALTREQADRIIELVINQRRNCLFAGATGSGKTTLINAVLARIPRHERLLLIEDAKELNADHPHALGMLTNADDGWPAVECVKLAMRLRPDRVILGETRGDETYDLLRVLNSGHSGSMSSIHADSAELALDAFEMLYQQSLPPNASISGEAARRYISKNIHVVVFVSRRTVVQDDVARVVRGVEQICVVKGVNKEGNYDLEDIT